MKKKVAIVGASGFTGVELIKILLNHSEFEITTLFSSSGNEKIEDLYPALHGVFECDIQKADIDKIAAHDLVFLAVPHKTAMAFVKELYNKVKIVDFSADYRLSLHNYEEYYCPHIDIHNLTNAVYGLPEYFKEQIKTTSLVANPGCYPTATLLGLLPFADMVENVFVDAKSGVSGAGKKLNETTQFVHTNENTFAYNPLRHRHSVEIKQYSNLDVAFVPHLLPVTRGMLISIYATLKESVCARDILLERYDNEPFIRIKDKPVDIKSTAGTNFCDIYVAQDKNKLFINTSIDNLLRGASSQAVVNANLMMGYDETTAIPSIAYIP
ncbi:MAG: N-acetyl-gamma-glutamyl-phosphate reductase [Epsilonproteobacteria bacterium]|nr:N-acetyl-gamma-glutamyl-phosphate reductase [Campylobacterota bacterium]